MRNLLGRLLGSLLGRIHVGDDWRRTASASKAFRLGNILIAAGQITREQLNDTLAQQKDSPGKIGELLVERGYLQQSQVDQGIRLQQILVAMTLGTAIALSLPVTVEAAGSTASFSATASVKKVARLTVLHQQSQMVITSENIAQGYLEVPAASSVEIRNSSLSGYMIAFELQEGPFQQVIISGLGTELQINSGSGWLLKPHSNGPEVLELTYRFILPSDTNPGAYPWPLRISAVAI
jgi:hypothetical protein